MVYESSYIGFFGDVTYLGSVSWPLGKERHILTLISTLWAEGTSCFSFAEALSKAGAEMSAIRTLAPSRAKRIEVSRPIPL